MGDVVNSACHIANKAGRDYREPIIVSSIFYSNLSEDNQKFFKTTSIDWNTYYQCNVVNTNMDNWYDENCR